MKIFISYSHSDEWLKDELVKHLSALRRNGVIDVWHDRLIPPGGALGSQIDANLGDSDVILLLISPDFISSDYCFTVEYQKALERHKKGEIDIVPVIIRDCDWDVGGLRDFLALPQDGTPVTQQAHSKTDAAQRDSAWREVADGLKVIVEAQKKRLEPPTLTPAFEHALFITHIARHPQMATFDEDKVFIDPDLYLEKRNEQISSLERVIDLCASEKALVFSGADRSGKTLLAKKLQFEMTNKGTPAVRISGRGIRNADFQRLMRRAVAEQLTRQDYPTYLILVIVDDFDECNLGDRTKEEFVRFLDANYCKIILFSFSNAPSVFFASNALPDPAVININAMTNDKLFLLVHRWKVAGAPTYYVPDDTDVLTSFERLQLIFEQTEVERSPCFAVNLLHLIETSIGSDIAVSSHAACYDMMISQRLVQMGIEWKNVDECKNFLSMVAYRAYIDTETGCIDKGAFEECIEVFKVQYLSSGEMLGMASVGSFLERTESGYVFSEEYIWFFLCARYVVRILQVQDRKKYVDFVEKCTENIFQKKFANIVIYISYFSNDNFVVESLLKILDNLFSKADKWILSDDSREIMLGMPADSSLLIVFPETDVIGAQSDTFEKKLELLKERVVSVIDDVKSVVARYTLPFLNHKIDDSLFVEDMDVETANADSYIRNVNALLRIHSIIGQILNSRPGTFGAQFVLDCITRMVQASGRYATLNHAIATVLVYEQSQQQARQSVSRTFSSSSNLTEEEQYEKVVKIFLFWSVYLSHAGLARYLSQEHAVRALSRLTEDFDNEDHKTKQGNIPYNFTIVKTIARLYQTKVVDRHEIENIVQTYGQHSSIMNLLRVAFHIYTYYMALPYDDKQWLSDKLRMSLNKLEVQRIKATEGRKDRRALGPERRPT